MTRPPRHRRASARRPPRQLVVAFVVACAAPAVDGGDRSASPTRSRRAPPPGSVCWDEPAPAPTDDPGATALLPPQCGEGGAFAVAQPTAFTPQAAPLDPAVLLHPEAAEPVFLGSPPPHVAPPWQRATAVGWVRADTEQVATARVLGPPDLAWVGATWRGAYAHGDQLGLVYDAGFVQTTGDRVAEHWQTASAPAVSVAGVWAPWWRIHSDGRTRTSRAGWWPPGLTAALSPEDQTPVGLVEVGGAVVDGVWYVQEAEHTLAIDLSTGRALWETRGHVDLKRPCEPTLKTPDGRFALQPATASSAACPDVAVQRWAPVEASSGPAAPRWRAWYAPEIGWATLSPDGWLNGLDPYAQVLRRDPGGALSPAWPTAYHLRDIADGPRPRPLADPSTPMDGERWAATTDGWSGLIHVESGRRVGLWQQADLRGVRLAAIAYGPYGEAAWSERYDERGVVRERDAGGVRAWFDDRGAPVP